MPKVRRFFFGFFGALFGGALILLTVEIVIAAVTEGR